MINVQNDREDTVLNRTGWTLGQMSRERGLIDFTPREIVVYVVPFPTPVIQVNVNVHVNVNVNDQTLVTT